MGTFTSHELEFAASAANYYDVTLDYVRDQLTLTVSTSLGQLRSVQFVRCERGFSN